jgi:hypothetical protein
VAGGDDSEPVRRVWVPQVAVDVDALRVRTNVAESRRTDPVGRAVIRGVRDPHRSGRLRQLVAWKA